MDVCVGVRVSVCVRACIHSGQRAWSLPDWLEQERSRKQALGSAAIEGKFRFMSGRMGGQFRRARHCRASTLRPSGKSEETAAEAIGLAFF